MVSKQFYQDIDMVNVGQLIGTRHQNVNNAYMTAMVTLLGSNNKGLVVWNTDQNKEFVWDGTSFIPHGTIQNASTSQPGVVQLNDNINSTSTTQAATANAVKKAYDIGNNKLPLTGGYLTGPITSNSNVSATAFNATSESHFSNGTYTDTHVGTTYAIKASQGISTDKLNISGKIDIVWNSTENSIDFILL